MTFTAGRAAIAARVEAQLATERTGMTPTAAPPPALRCEACGYLTYANGHLIMCGPGSLQSRNLDRIL